MNYNVPQGELFSDSMAKEIKEKLYHVDVEPITVFKRYDI